MNGIEGKPPVYRNSKKKSYSTEKYKENLPKFKEWYNENFEVEQ